MSTVNDLLLFLSSHGLSYLARFLKTRLDKFTFQDYICPVGIESPKDGTKSMIITRDLAPKLLSAAAQFPAIAVLGPRQSGKTTLVTTTFPEYRYFSFEDPHVRALARVDPRAFLNEYKHEAGLILDEIQNIPELFSYLQTHIDLNKKKGFFIITGSQNFALNQAITQSLAGRIAIFTLLPLSIHELEQAQLLPEKIDQLLFKGAYPSVHADGINALDWYRSYIATYVERDVRQIRNVTDLNAFQNFMKLCAGRVGQVLNITSLSNDSGLSVHTIKQWLSVLAASYIIFLLQPYYRNWSKRVIKAPKLFFYDTGIAVSLLSLSEPQQLFDYHLRGNLFESFIIADFFKQRLNKGLNPNCYYWRDKAGHEIDCIAEKNQHLIPIEIKASQTFNKSFLDYVNTWNKLSSTKPENNVLVYGGDINQTTALGRILGWRSIGNLLEP